MKVVRLVVAGLVTGAAAAFVAALLRPRRPGGYDPLQTSRAVPAGAAGTPDAG